MKPSEALRKARDLITLEDRFIKSEAAMLRSGKECFPDDPMAFRFDAFGALECVAGDGGFASSCYEYFIRANGISIGTFTAWGRYPDRTHAEVLAAFDRAIALAEAEGH